MDSQYEAVIEVTKGQILNIGREKNSIQKMQHS